MGKYAIILLLFLVGVLMTYNMGMNSLGILSVERNIESLNENQARNIAHSSMNSLLAHIMNVDGSEFILTDNQSKFFPANGDFYFWEQLGGYYRYFIRHEGHTGEDWLFITSTGQIESNIYTANAVLKLTSAGWEPTLPFAVFSDGDIHTQGSPRIIGHAATNSVNPGAVTVGWGGVTTIDSTLYIGPGGNPSTVVNLPSWNPNSIRDGIKNLPRTLEYELPEFPEFPAKSVSGGSITVTAWPNNHPVLEANQVNGIYYDAITITQNTDLTLNLPPGNHVMHVRDLDLVQGRLHILGGGKLTIFVENKLALGGGSAVNYEGNFKNLMVYHKGEPEIFFAGNTRFRGSIYSETADVKIGGSLQIEGSILTGGESVVVQGAANAHRCALYAPNADVVFEGSGSLWGAVISKNFKMTGNTRVTYDRDVVDYLPEIGVGGTGRYELISWY